MRRHSIAAATAALVLAAGSSVGLASQILSPAAAGFVDGYGQMANAFDRQPTWDGTRPVSLETDYAAATMESWNTSTVYWVDLGSNWADWRIEQVWTKYMKDRAGDPFPFAATWWDDDKDAVNDTGSDVTSSLNFNTKVHTGSGVDSWGEWIRDFDMTATPMTPQGQYLMLTLGANKPAQATEYAFVGVVPEPGSLCLLGAAIGGLLIGRRRGHA